MIKIPIFAPSMACLFKYILVLFCLLPFLHGEAEALQAEASTTETLQEETTVNASEEASTLSITTLSRTSTNSFRNNFGSRCGINLQGSAHTVNLYTYNFSHSHSKPTFTTLSVPNHSLIRLGKFVI